VGIVRIPIVCSQRSVKLKKNHEPTYLILSGYPKQTHFVRLFCHQLVQLAGVISTVVDESKSLTLVIRPNYS